MVERMTENDTRERTINYLRVSVTDRCNLRCSYCMPPEGINLKPEAEILTFEEIVEIVRAGVNWGIERVRLTGGEPLVRKNLTTLIKCLNRIKGLKEIMLTTNGVLLPGREEKLSQAGVDRVNISLDTLKPDRFKSETGADSWDEVWTGIKGSLQHLAPVKLNVVIRKGFNDDEIPAFVALTEKHPLHVRFIEFMPTKADKIKQQEQYLSNKIIRERIGSEYKLQPVEIKAGSGPARYFKIPDSKGTVGFISSISRHFCDNCNRLRLTATGKLRSCLFSSRGVELKEIVRRDVESDRLEQEFDRAVRLKSLKSKSGSSLVSHMSEIGG